MNLLFVSSCEMLHFAMSFIKQNKNCIKQTLESEQYGLEIIFSTWNTLDLCGPLVK